VALDPTEVDGVEGSDGAQSRSLIELIAASLDIGAGSRDA
jgi:hypothetical protein